MKKYLSALCVIILLVGGYIWNKSHENQAEEGDTSVRGDALYLLDQKSHKEDQGTLVVPNLTDQKAEEVVGKDFEGIFTKIEDAGEFTAKLGELLDYGDEESALAEARSLASHPNREVRIEALRAMWWIGASAAFDIVSFIGDTDTEINQFAEEALWNAIDEMEQPALKIQLLESAMETSGIALRMQALDMLIFLPEQLSFPVISSMLGDSSEEVSTLAADHLEFLSEKAFSSEADAMNWFESNKETLEP